LLSPRSVRLYPILEDELGLKLFSRTHRNARLTAEGGIFYADAARILQQQHRGAIRRPGFCIGDAEYGGSNVLYFSGPTDAFVPGLASGTVAGFALLD
jgi:hypothetical protein